MFAIGKDSRATAVVLSGEFYRLIHTMIPELEKEMGLEWPLQWLNLDDVPNLLDMMSGQVFDPVPMDWTICESKKSTEK